jgi:predicted transcriptional regulator
MATTIQISQDLLLELKSRKMYEKETYEEIIRDIIEDTKELNDATKKLIKEAEEDFLHGRVYTHDQIKKELGL